MIPAMNDNETIIRGKPRASGDDPQWFNNVFLQSG